MRFDIRGKPVSSILKIHLTPGEGVILHPLVKVIMEGVAVERVFLEGQILHRFRAIRPDAFLWVSHIRAVDIHPVSAKGEVLLVNRDAYIGHYGSLRVKSFREKDRFIRLEGVGILWIGDEMAVEELILSPGEELVIEDSHILLMDESAYRNLQSLYTPSAHLPALHGQPLRVRGPGRLIIRSRKISFVDMAFSMFRNLLKD